MLLPMSPCATPGAPWHCTHLSRKHPAPRSCIRSSESGGSSMSRARRRTDWRIAFSSIVWMGWKCCSVEATLYSPPYTTAAAASAAATASATVVAAAANSTVLFCIARSFSPTDRHAWARIPRMSCPFHRAALAAAAAALLMSGCGESGRPAEAASASAERGRLLIAQYQCGSCHTIPGVPASRGHVASPLTSFGQRSYIAGRLANRPDILAQWIESPQALVPGTAMPDMGVSAADARDMAAYLSSLQ
jgi:cytochrome c